MSDEWIDTKSGWRLGFYRWEDSVIGDTRHRRVYKSKFQRRAAPGKRWRRWP